MTKFLIIFFSINLCFGNVFCQEKSFELIGFIMPDNKQPLSYRLNLDVDNKGNVTGKSITDYYGEHSTESSIKGTYDLQKNRVSFTEISNISTKSKADASTFCYVGVKDLKIETKKRKSILSGEFNGNFISGESCVNGKIYLVAASVLEELNISEKVIAEAEQNYNEIRNSNTAITSEDIQKTINASGRITAENPYKVGWKSNVIRLAVWDSYTVDQDIINIWVNGVLEHKDIEINDKKKFYSFELDDSDFYIEIEAVNEGSSPPNTVNLILFDGEKQYSLLTRLSKGEKAMMSFVK